MPETRQPSKNALLAPFVSKIAAWLRHWRDNDRGADGLNACGCTEVARIARDLGVSTSELRALARQGPDAAALLPRMLDALGIDAKAIARDEPGVMHDLQRLCGQCARKVECANDLAGGGAADNYRAYCPNAPTIEALKPR
ncbi:MAG: hypothetical protein HY056_10650 [Proteobacteria bacterium]|nr:hypothetical protein [Pseudomonadota bacterium]